MNSVGLCIFLQKRSNRSRYLTFVQPRGQHCGCVTLATKPMWWWCVCIYKDILGRFLNKSFTKGTGLCACMLHPRPESWDIKKKRCGKNLSPLKWRPPGLSCPLRGNPPPWGFPSRVSIFSRFSALCTHAFHPGWPHGYSTLCQVQLLWVVSCFYHRFRTDSSLSKGGSQVSWWLSWDYSSNAWLLRIEGYRSHMGLREGGWGFWGSEWKRRDGNGIQRWDSGLLGGLSTWTVRSSVGKAGISNGVPILLYCIHLANIYWAPLIYAGYWSRCWGSSSEENKMLLKF